MTLLKVSTADDDVAKSVDSQQLADVVGSDNFSKLFFIFLRRKRREKFSFFVLRLVFSFLRFLKNVQKDGSVKKVRQILTDKANRNKVFCIFRGKNNNNDLITSKNHDEASPLKRPKD